MNSFFDFITDWLQQILTFITDWASPLVSDVQERLLPITEQIKPIWHDPIWQALIIIFVVLLVVVLLVKFSQLFVVKGTQLLQNLWATLTGLLSFFKKPIKHFLDFTQKLRQRLARKKRRSTALKLRMTRIVDSIKYITTRRDWRYQTSWFLLIGEETADKSSLIASIRNGRRATLLAQEKHLHAAGSHWHFFDNGILIDVAHSPRPEPSPTSDEQSIKQIYLKRLHKIISLVHRYRPERPIDGVVLTLSAESLMAASTPAQCNALGETLYQQLWLLQKKTGFIIPTYLVVTQCQVISGFSAFWQAQPPERYDEIMGWSNPLRLETTFDPAWINQAFEKIVENLQDAQLNMAASSRDIEDTDNFLLFHQYFNHLCKPLKTVSDAIFSSSKIQASIPLRGIYFTGEVQQQSRFADHLFNKKIFTEQNLAVPLAKTLLSTERTLRGFQIGTLCAVIIALFWLGTDTWRMHDYNSNLTRVLGHIDGEDKDKAKKTDCGPLGFNEYRMLSGLSEVGHNPTFYSMPTSIPDFQFEQNASIIGKNVLAPKLFSQFECRFSEKSDVLENEKLDILKSTAAKGLTANTNAVDLLQYLKSIATYESRYNDFLYLSGPLGTDNLIAEKLEALLDYLYDSPTPEAALKTTDLIAKAIQLMEYKAASTPFDRRGIVDNINSAAAQVKISMLNQAARAPTIDEGPHAGDPLLTQLSELKTWLTSMNTQWSGPFSESLCGEIEQQLREPITTLKNSNHYDESKLDDLLAHFDETTCYQGVREELTKTNVLGYGPAFELSDEVLLLNPKLAKLIPQITDLERLPFMQPNTELRTLTSSNTSVIEWRLAPLEKAISAIADYQNFVSVHWSEQSACPEENDCPEQSTFFAYFVKDQVQNRIARLIHESMVMGSEAPAEKGLFSSQEDKQAALDSKLRTFKIAQNALLQLNQQLTQSDENTNRETLQESVRQFVQDRFFELDILMKDAQIYQSSAAPQWANQTFSQALFRVQTNKQLEQFVQSERHRLSKLTYNYAQPLLTYLHNANALEEAGSSAARWLSTLRTLDENQRKVPNTDISKLENFITGSLAEQDNSDCPTYSLVDNNTLGASWFAEKQLQLSRQVWAHCKGASEAIAIQNYATLAHNFSKQLAGRYPFADLSKAGENELSFASVNAFFNDPQNDPAILLAQLKNLEKLKPGSVGSAWSTFLNQLRTFKTWWQAGVTSDAASWSTNLDVIFHGLPNNAVGADQIITWTLASDSARIGFPNDGNSLTWQVGQPLTMQLQWASSSAYMPFINNTKTQKTYPNPSNVMFNTQGRWGVLEWLSRYANPALDEKMNMPQGNYVLTFPVPVSLKTKLPQDRKVAYTSLPNILISSSIVDSKGVDTLLIWPLNLPRRAPGLNE